MCHGDAEQIGYNSPPVSYDCVVKVFPMEIEFRLEILFFARIGKIECFFRSHGHENLHHLEDTVVEYTFVGITLNLKGSLTYIYFGTFQLYMNHRHAIDEQHHIAPSVTAQRVRSLETRLAGNLVAALSGTDFACIENLQIDFFAVIVCIGRIVAFDAYLSAIDKHIHGVWAVAQIHLIDDLAHLTRSKRIIA